MTDAPPSLWRNREFTAALGQSGAVRLVIVEPRSLQCRFSTAEHSAMRTLVPPAHLSTAVARNEARSFSTSLPGPPLGGLLFGIAKAVPFFADAVTFLLSLVLLGPAVNAALFGHQAPITPDRLQGRVISVVVLAATSVQTAAPVLAGLLITAWRTAAAILTFGVAVAGAAVAATASRGIRTMQPVPEPVA